MLGSSLDVMKFRKFIKDYAKITIALTELTKGSNQNKPFKWTKECEATFKTVKSILIKSPQMYF